MSIGTIKEVLMRRDGIDEEDAQQQIDEAKELLQEYLEDDDQESAYNICEECFGLEPDYLMELMP